MFGRPCILVVLKEHTCSHQVPNIHETVDQSVENTRKRSKILEGACITKTRIIFLPYQVCNPSLDTFLEHRVRSQDDPNLAAECRYPEIHMQDCIFRQFVTALVEDLRHRRQEVVGIIIKKGAPTPIRGLLKVFKLIYKVV